MKEIMEIMDISRQLQDPTQTRNDMNEAAELVMAMLRKKYLGRMTDTLYKIQDHSRKDPPKEVALLRSLKPFTHSDNHEHIDKMTELMILFDTFGRVREAERGYRNADKGQSGGVYGMDSAIHADGIYEIDHNCSPSM